MTHVARLKNQDWMSSAEVCELFSIFKSQGVTARYVGGCVRDALLNRPVFDVDIAIDIPPHETKAILEAHDITCVPTGFDHGTVTAVLNQKTFQITSLRSDIKTDGRHAVVSYTKDWTTDAQRRDFTMNALYSDSNGFVYDPLGSGVTDLKAGVVRFIGNPFKRIEEDGLRALRFFRFTAHYSRQGIETIGLKACITNVECLKALSMERIQYELRRLVTAPRVAEMVQLLYSSGLIAQIFQAITVSERVIKAFEYCEKLETFLGVKVSSLIKVIMLVGLEKYALILSTLKLSKKERAYIESVLSQLKPDTFSLSDLQLKKSLYNYGPHVSMDLILLNALNLYLQPNISYNDVVNEIKPLLRKAKTWRHPQFPIKGGDLIDVGFKAGPGVSSTMAKVKDWWIANDFTPSKQQCLDFALELLPSGNNL